MPAPAEYERASAQFYDYLVDARDTAGLWSTHVTYTMTQGVVQVLRRRLSTGDAIAFANVLPVCLRARFVTDGDPDDDKRPLTTCLRGCPRAPSSSGSRNLVLTMALRG